MISNYVLYALPSGDMETMKIKLEEVLNIQLTYIPASSWPEYYSTPHDPHRDVVSLFWNWDDEDEGFSESKFSDYPLLISIYDTEKQDDYHERIMESKWLSAVLVKRKEKFETDFRQ